MTPKSQPSPHFWMKRSHQKKACFPVPCLIEAMASDSIAEQAALWVWLNSSRETGLADVHRNMVSIVGIHPLTEELPMFFQGVLAVPK